MAPAVEYIIRRAGGLQSAVEKARTVERAIGTDHTAAVNVRALLNTQQAEAAERHPHAQIHLDATAELRVAANHTLKAAIAEAVDNAVEHVDDPEPTVRLSATARSDDRVDVSVEDDGPGVPEHERRVLEAGEESALQHGSGLGLWMMHWVVTSLGGEVTIADGDGGGTVVTFTLPRADSEGAPPE